MIFFLGGGVLAVWVFYIGHNPTQAGGLERNLTTAASRATITEGTASF